MRVRILNHDAYGDVCGYWSDEFPLGSIQEVVNFFPDTGEVEVLDGAGQEVTFAPSEYEVVGE